MRQIRLRRAILAVTCLYVFSVDGAIAAEKPWFRYDNLYFEVYSDASEKKSRRLIEELENFRAATTQFLKFELPANIPKTQVIILNSKKDFRELVGDWQVDGFVTGVRGVPYIVMPVGGAGTLSKMTIRHEYVHILVGYNENEFPPWFHEGIAEFMSSTEFRDKDTRFSIGEQTLRVPVPGTTLPWEDLVRDDLEFHAIKRSVTASNAYYQAWQLTHFLLIGDELGNYEDFTRYLGYYNSGMSSVAAIETVFDMSPNELGRKAERAYGSRIPYYILEFEPGMQDHDFRREPYDAVSIAATLEDIRDVLKPYSQPDGE